MDSCCTEHPVIFCQVCKQSACRNHVSSIFMRSHLTANVLTESGREVFFCGDIEVIYFKMVLLFL